MLKPEDVKGYKPISWEEFDEQYVLDDADSVLDYFDTNTDEVWLAGAGEGVSFIPVEHPDGNFLVFIPNDDDFRPEEVKSVLRDFASGKMTSVRAEDAEEKDSVWIFNGQGGHYIAYVAKETKEESFRRRGRMLREGKEYKLIIMPHIIVDVWDVKEDEVVDGSEYTDYLEPRVFVTEDGLCNYVALWTWQDNGLDGKVTEMAKNPKTKDCVAIEDDDDFYDEDEENLGGKIIVIGSNSADKIDLAPLDSCKYKWTISVGYEWETVSKEDYETYKDQALDI